MVEVRYADEFNSIVAVGTQSLFIVNCYLLIGTHGGIAQLGEHLLCKQGVISSNLIISTNGPIAQLVRAHD